MIAYLLLFVNTILGFVFLRRFGGDNLTLLFYPSESTKPITSAKLRSLRFGEIERVALNRLKRDRHGS
jgi:hypothetical protein